VYDGGWFDIVMGSGVYWWVLWEKKFLGGNMCEGVLFGGVRFCID